MVWDKLPALGLNRFDSFGKTNPGQSGTPIKPNNQNPFSQPASQPGGTSALQTKGPNPFGTPGNGPPTRLDALI